MLTKLKKSDVELEELKRKEARLFELKSEIYERLSEINELVIGHDMYDLLSWNDWMTGPAMLLHDEPTMRVDLWATVWADDDGQLGNFKDVPLLDLSLLCNGNPNKV